MPKNDIQAAAKPVYVNVKDLRPAEDEDTCLRPLGLCDLGGCCDVCFYNPEKQAARAKKQDGEG